MPDKYTAKINKENSGAYLDVYTEANSQYEADEIFKAKYPEHRVIGTHKIEAEDSSESSKSGCAGVIAAFAIIPLAGLMLRLSA